MTGVVQAFADEVTALGFRAHVGSFHPRDDAGRMVPLRREHFPYVVVRAGITPEYSGNNQWSSTLADMVDKVEVPLRVTYAGLTFDSASGLMSSVRKALNRRVMVVPGVACSRLKMMALIGVAEDTTADVNGVYPWFGVDEYRLTVAKER